MVKMIMTGLNETIGTSKKEKVVSFNSNLRAISRKVEQLEVNMARVILSVTKNQPKTSTRLSNGTIIWMLKRYTELDRHKSHKHLAIIMASKCKWEANT